MPSAPTTRSPLTEPPSAKYKWPSAVTPVTLEPVTISAPAPVAARRSEWCRADRVVMTQREDSDMLLLVIERSCSSQIPNDRIGSLTSSDSTGTPSASKALRPFSSNSMPAPISRSSVACSWTRACQPARLSAAATESPAIPPPTISARRIMFLGWAPAELGCESARRSHERLAHFTRTLSQAEFRARGAERGDNPAPPVTNRSSHCKEVRFQFLVSGGKPQPPSLFDQAAQLGNVVCRIRGDPFEGHAFEQQGKICFAVVQEEGFPYRGAVGRRGAADPAHRLHRTR